MIALVLSCVGAALAAIAAGMTGADARRALAPLLAVGLALGAYLQAEPAGLGKPAIVAVARGADGLPAASVVTFDQEDGGRSVRRVVLERALPAAAPAFLTTIGLALLLVLLGSTGRLPKGPAVDRGVPAVLAGLLGLCGAMLAGTFGPPSGSGEAEVRAVLAGLSLAPLGKIGSFTVPDGALTYVAGSGLGLFAGAALLVVATFVPASAARAASVALLGALLAACAPLADLWFTGGFAWRGPTGAIWGAALLALGAYLDRGAPRRAGALAGLAAALALLAL